MDASRTCRGCVVELSRSRMAPKSLSHNSIPSGPTLPWTVVGLGDVPQTLCHRGILYGFPQYIRYAAGPKEEKRAGAHFMATLKHLDDTIAQLFVFCK